MKILPNSSSIVSSVQPVDPFKNTDSSTSSGFTLLQGHIQLMAMVPHLPENQLSPKWKSSEALLDDRDSMDAKRSLSVISPRLMPSASQYRRHNLPTILAEKAMASQGGFHQALSWHNAPCLSKITIPIPTKPVTMPSFAKFIPGTKRTTVSRMESTTCFPVIPNQSRYHTVSMVKEQTMEPQTSPGLYMNAYPYLLSPMDCTVFNLLPPHNYSISGSNGDHISTFYSPPRCYEPCQNGIFFPQTPTYLPTSQSLLNPAIVSTHVQSPYETQSMPNFGTTATIAYSNNRSHVGGRYHHSYSMPNCNMSHKSLSSTPKHGNNSCTSGIGLPLESHQELFRSTNAVSIPDICKDPHELFHVQTDKQPCNSVSAFYGLNKHDVSVVVEGSSSEYEDGLHKTSRFIRKKDCSKLSLLHNYNDMVTEQKQNIRIPMDTSLAILGPDSLPTKISSTPRVTHSPVQSVSGVEVDIDERICNGNGCCSQCGYDKTKLTHNVLKRNENRKRSPPRKTIKYVKPVVVAVHDCFPSDSSESECTDTDSQRKSSSNINNNTMIKKKKPRIDAILHKTKPIGKEEVFDDLSDLSLDEVRLYTCEYLTELLTSDDWENCYNALQTMVRMARHRPKTLLNYLGPILWFAFKHLTSPKSALCRAAIVTFRELFQSIGSALDNDLEKLTEKLVIKSLAPNKFIREECDRALEAMVRHCSMIKVLTAMEIVSKMPHVRAACQRISRMTKQFIAVASVDTCLRSMYAEKLLPMLFSFMTDANNETRTAAKEALSMLMNHLQFEQAVTKYVTFDRNCTEVFKKLDKMRGRNRSNRMVLGGTRYQSSSM
ncbi:unnamed protein product [Orchesella dallaii]|uniref:TOG domain-containing protein n=1 Tax=Orchesella dallaii TaxID=48710 RepID=A0ABP1RQV7_9HEXA